MTNRIIAYATVICLLCAAKVNASVDVDDFSATFISNNVTNDGVAQLLNVLEKNSVGKGRKLLGQKYHECVVYSTAQRNSATYAIYPKSLSKCTLKLPKNFYFVCLCSPDKSVCKKFANVVNYAVHHPEVNGDFYFGDHLTINSAQFVYTNCPADGGCTALIQAGFPGAC